MPDGSTVIVMSNKDRPSSLGRGVLDGRRHYLLCIVSKDGETKSHNYDVSEGTGYWFSKASAVRAAKAMASK